MEPGEKQEKTVQPNDIRFSDLCFLFERLGKTKKKQEKDHLYSLFWRKLPPNISAFPVMRLFLPLLDRGRMYRVKHTNLAKLYVSALSLERTSSVARQLLEWKKPTASREGTGDLASVVFHVVSTRCLAEQPTMTVGRVNELLDLLWRAERDEERQRIFAGLIREATPLEHKWLVRIVLKEMKIGSTEDTHCADLERVCADLADPVHRRELEGQTITLGMPIKPMLAMRCAPTRVRDKILSSRSTLVVEPKFDGERIQVHKNGDQVLMFSRNCKDCTGLYHKFIPIVQKYVSPARCILDGELLVWDRYEQKFEEFGHLKTTAKNRGFDSKAEVNMHEAAEGESEGKQLCLVCFDILFLDEGPVMQLPYRDRRQLLERCLIPQPHRLEIVEQVPIRSFEDVVSEFDRAIIDRNEEGIMVKEQEATYVPDERRDKWIKMKPDYVNGMGEDFDLAIMAAWFGTGDRHSGLLSEFLLGVKSGATYLSFARVGTGINVEDLRQLNDELRPYLIPHDAAHEPPTCYDVGPKFLESVGKDHPDVFVPPEHSKVLQVKGHQFVPSDKYRVGYTLRFPRVVRIRNDKSPNEAMDMASVTRMIEEGGGRLRLAARRYRDVLGDEGGKEQGGEPGLSSLNAKRGKGRRMIKYDPQELLWSAFRERQRTQKSEGLFKGSEFWVINGEPTGQYTKQAIETLILQNGGQVVANTTTTMFCAIAATAGTVRTQALISANTHDLIHYQWLVDSLQAGELLTFDPRVHLIHACPATAKRIAEEFDPFGDGYYRCTQVPQLKDLFSRLPPSSARPIPLFPPFWNILDDDSDGDGAGPEKAPPRLLAPPQTATVASIERHYHLETRWSLFREFVVYVDRFLVVGDPTGGSIPLSAPTALTLAAIRLSLFGARLADRIDAQTTHIVMDPDDRSREPAIRDVLRRLRLQAPDALEKHIVGVEWVSGCVAGEGQLLDEQPFAIRPAASPPPIEGKARPRAAPLGREDSDDRPAKMPRSEEE
ncbi:putative DNA ligase 4 [Paratrimastix pyriformis]|uniref:DNA ligase n=1 Tax=Paratrimastix pyriformis TaxID=342808 RepID=A0ABQ8UDT4_9EUKA|nr:putative DNA ligase 4 [Paratrimastix pyriformis]